MQATRRRRSSCCCRGPYVLLPVARADPAPRAVDARDRARPPWVGRLRFARGRRPSPAGPGSQRPIAAGSARHRTRTGRPWPGWRSRPTPGDRGRGGGARAHRFDRVRRMALAPDPRAPVAGGRRGHRLHPLVVRQFFGAGMGHRERLSEADLREYRRPFERADGVQRFTRIVAGFDGEGLVGLEPRLGELEIPAFVLWGGRRVPAGRARRTPGRRVALGVGGAPARMRPLPARGCPRDRRAADRAVAPHQYLRLPQAHAHDEGAVTVELGRRAPEDGRW